MEIIKEFKRIENTIDCYINEQGIVLSMNDGTILKQIRPQLHSSGYLTVKLQTPNGRSHFFVHRLVAQVFIENPFCKSDVNHKDLDKTNNNLSNLEWVTRSENLKHFYSESSKTQSTRCNLYDNDVLIGEFDSIRKACIYVDKNIEPCNINSMSNQLRIGVKPYRGRFSITRI